MDKLNVVKMTRKDIKGLPLVKNGKMGATSKVYRLNNLECLKIFNYNLSEYELYRINKFTNMCITSVNFPTKLVIVDKKFKGYISDFINGESLDTLSCIGYSEFINAAVPLLEAIRKVSVERIRIFDSHEGNIMYNYDTGMLEIIDPVEWSFDCSSSIKEIHEKNFKMINSTIRRYLFHNSDIYNATTYIPNLKDITISDDFVEYYETLREYMEEAKNVKIKSIVDSRRYI